jgi:hypothetical protein
MRQQNAATAPHAGHCMLGTVKLRLMCDTVGGTRDTDARSTAALPERSFRAAPVPKCSPSRRTCYGYTGC